MAEETGAAAEQRPQVKTQILNQFIRDVSFENILAQKGSTTEVKPNVNVRIGLDVKKRPNEGEYEVILKTKAETTNATDGNTLYLLELDYAGLFRIEGVPQEQLHPYLMIECPRLIFPFLRRVVNDITRDGGFPPLNLESVDFVDMYRKQIEAAKAQAENAPVS